VHDSHAYQHCGLKTAPLLLTPEGTTALGLLEREAGAAGAGRHLLQLGVREVRAGGAPALRETSQIV
jgi:hypothetical protein